MADFLSRIQLNQAYVELVQNMGFIIEDEIVNKTRSQIRIGMEKRKDTVVPF